MTRESYPESILELILSGDAVPKSGRILCKAVTAYETDELAARVARISGRDVKEVAQDMGVDTSAGNQGKAVREAPYHEVVACDPAVTEEDPDICPGALVKFVTASADFAKDKAYVFVKSNHIIAATKAGR